MLKENAHLTDRPKDYSHMGYDKHEPHAYEA